MTFRVGQKVVCVRDAPSRFTVLAHLPCLLVKGCIYTIRRIESVDGWCAVWLEELVNPVLDIWLDRGPEEPAWNATRFRPIVERKTDISIFTKMLTPEGVDA